MYHLWNKKHAVMLLVFLLVWGCDSQQREQARRPGAQKPEPSEVQKFVASPPRAEDWYMFMHNLGFSGVSPDKTLTPPLELLWKFKTGGPIYASPVIVDGILYIGSTDDKLYALDAKEWGIKWVFDAGAPIRYSATVLGGRVFFTTRNDSVYALNAKTGDKLWEFKSKNWMDAPPIVVDNRVYIGVFPSKIYLLNASTGTLESTRERTIRIRGIEYGCANGVLRPIFPEHTAEVWRDRTAGSESYPVTANGVVYIGARNGQLHAFDAATKTQVWAYQLDGFVEAAPAICDGILYATSGDGHVYAFTNATEGPPPIADTRTHGVVVHDTAPVYTTKAGAFPLLTLNDGVELPIIQASNGWYEVELPNGTRGWMDTFVLGEFEEIDGILFNTTVWRHGAPRRLQLIEGAEIPRWSPNGELIAFLKRDDLSSRYWRANELWIADPKTEQARKLYTGHFYNPDISWSLDSRLLAFEVDEAGERYIYTVDWKLGRTKQLASGQAPAWSPTSNRLVFRHREKGTDIIYRVNSDSSDLRTIARVPIERPQRAYTYLPAPAWAHDGTRIAFGVNNAKYVGVRIQNIEGQQLKEIPTQHQQVHRVKWAADGTCLAYVLSGSNRLGQRIDKQLHISETEPASSRRYVLKHTSPAWSPTGKRLAYLEREDCEGIRWKVWIYDVESGKKTAIARTASKLTSVVWMPDGEHLCLWQTSDYLRDNAYKPAVTKGWILSIDNP